ncbi:MAG: cupin domain-containing protein [Oscillospiraceae bacterium]|nr:cupin domain-containing protein [Oscillospiraceae bacterium]
MPKEIVIQNVKTADYTTVDMRKACHYEGELKEDYVHDMCRVSSPSTGHQLYVTLYSLPPRTSSYPYHYHAAAEEVFYIISGSGILETPDGETAVSEGDVLVAPRGERGAHKLRNPSDCEPLVYLDVDNSFPAELTFHPHTGKAVMTDYEGKFQKAYRINSDVNYLEGE